MRTAYLSDWPDALKEERSVERIERIENWRYKGCGKVIDKAAGLVSVLGFLIEFHDLPWDGPVEFEIERLDLG